MFLSNTDKLGDAAYTGEWGKMNKETLDAIAAYQTNHKLTGDGMWGFWTDQVHGVMDNATLNKGSYTADYNNKHEQGDLLALPTNFTYTKLSDLSNKDAQAVQSDKGQTRTGGPTGLKIRHKGKTYNPGNYVSDEVLQAGKAVYETPDSPITVVLGGDKNLGTGVKLSAAYQTNAVPAMNAGLMTTPAVMVTEDAVSDTQPNHSVRQKRRADRKEERKEKRQERHRKLISRTAESTTD